MKALVTGATGLLGSHIVDRLLHRGDEVRALARITSDVSHLRDWEVDIRTGDVVDRPSLEAAMEGVDAVYHAAAKVSDWGPWVEFEEITVRGTENVLEAAAGAGVERFLHVSTDSVYPYPPKFRGETFREDGAIEDSAPSWDPYARAKIAAEWTAWDYHNSGRLRVSIVRPGIILGERDKTIVPGIMRYLRGGAVYIGSGHNHMPCVYAGDVAEACILAATRDEAVGRAYNVAADTLTQRELFDCIAELSGDSPPKRAIPYRAVYVLGALNEAWTRLRRSNGRPTMTRMSTAMMAQDYFLDTTRAREELGWLPDVPVREAIRRSVEWLNEQRAKAASR